MAHGFLCSLLSLLWVFTLPTFGDEGGPPTLAIGASAPDFCLPGIDGQTHCLKEYAASKILVLAFTCNHCPTAQLYEKRIKQLAADYRDRGVALVAVEPNNPNAVRLDEMGYTDVGDSFDDMQTRAAYRHFNFPYLYDGETQKISRAYGPTATPHLFIFDAERRLRYEGRLDNNPREPLVTVKDARNALDALLGGKPVPVAKTPSVGCSTNELVTVSINYPDEQPGVFSALQKQHATSQNYLLGSTDIYALMAAFDPEWNAAVPYTMLIKPDGEVVYKRQGPIDSLALRRTIIAHLVDDDYIGHQAYWKTPADK